MLLLARIAGYPPSIAPSPAVHDGTAFTGSPDFVVTLIIVGAGLMLLAAGIGLGLFLCRRSAPS